MPLKLQMRASGLIVPLDEFKLENDPVGFVTLGDDIPYGVVLNMAHDGNQPRLLQVDAARNLKVVQGVASPLSPFNLTQLAGTALSVPRIAGLLNVNDVIPGANAILELFDNVGLNIARSASAANLAALSSLGAALVAPPGQWTAQHSPAVGVQATTTRASAGAAARNICTGFGFGFSAGAAIVASTIQVNLRDGASGVGTILKSWIFDLPAAIIAPFGIEVTGVEIPGTVNTAMTMEFSALLATLHQFVNLAGHIAS